MISASIAARQNFQAKLPEGHMMPTLMISLALRSLRHVTVGTSAGEVNTASATAQQQQQDSPHRERTRQLMYSPPELA